MADRGAKPGNNNASKGSQFRDALRKALASYDIGTIKRKKALYHVAKSLITKAIDGDIPAINMIADRLDGKPVQAIIGPQGEPITLVERIIVVQAIDNQDPGEIIEGEMVPDHESIGYVRNLEETQNVEEKTQ